MHDNARTVPKIVGQIGVDRFDEVLDRWGFPIRNVALLGRIREARQKERERNRPRQYGKGSYSEDRLIPALRRLCAEAATSAPRCFTAAEIAQAAGVSLQTVLNVERQALRNLRAKLGKTEREFRASLQS